MMRLYKIFIILFSLFPAVLLANIEKKHEKQKVIKRQFDVVKDATVYIKNKYGNINVSTWDKNLVEITVKIEVKGDNLDNITKKLNTIDVTFKATKSLVEAITTFETTRSKWSWWGNDQMDYKINYIVKLPISNQVNLNNKYGDIELLNELKGRAIIDCSYGAINLEKLSNDHNSIELKYSNDSEINYVKSANISGDYSSFEINRAKKLKLNTDYTHVKIGEIDQINFSDDYGSLAIEKVSSIEGSSDYGRVKIGTLTKSLKIDADFGGVYVKNIEKGFESILIDASYTGVKLRTNIDNNFTFKVAMKYSSFNYPRNDRIDLLKSIDKNTKKYYEGVYGSSKTSSNINITASYGNVSLKTNN